ncbi:hypothetical protein NTE_00752 [Candidatus Nitrososphaera evergladensis SR1]|jgi:hypothetical protein|uniref:DUF1326 domain-containing protein n=1 Tax=Candidatus Nitrososphaera evergladensis SR1 TaxID=1459636 RepID=A0A075MNW5_9ARCH|nr:DUF1326 domain-containing protein [Candidatus Nitrososphaera evergladensis]AIF82830.1 hypothetical protein NTE_00752 [Candidatus Nitrososphaera evergladensis SR1]
MSEDTPKWKASGDWFDVCKCNIPCPCTFAQAPSYGDCEGILAYHIKNGHYGETPLDGLNVMMVGGFKGNIWAGEAKATMGFFFDERANEKQREALQMIFTGKAGGFMGELAKAFGEDRGTEFVPIKFEIANDLAYWSAEVPGKVVARGEALTGPMTPPGKRVQTLNAPGSETGPGTVATWGRAVADEVDAMGFKWDWKGRSSKHIPFDWTGP